MPSYQGASKSSVSSSIELNCGTCQVMYSGSSGNQVSKPLNHILVYYFLQVKYQYVLTLAQGTWYALGLTKSITDRLRY